MAKKQDKEKPYPICANCEYCFETSRNFLLDRKYQLFCHHPAERHLPAPPDPITGSKRFIMRNIGTSDRIPEELILREEWPYCIAVNDKGQCTKFSPKAGREPPCQGDQFQE